MWAPHTVRPLEGIVKRNKRRSLNRYMSVCLHMQHAPGQRILSLVGQGNFGQVMAPAEAGEKPTMLVKRFVSFLNIPASQNSIIRGGCGNFCCFKLQLFSINWITAVSIFNLGKLQTVQFFMSSLFWFYNLIPLEFQATVWFTSIQQNFLGFIVLLWKTN